MVTADAQTAGRGRQGNAWASPRGNLHLSILLRPAAPIAGVLPLVAGVAAREALAALGVEARLKWPNDVLVGELKLAGILAEASAGPHGAEWAVVGMGVNVDPEEGLPQGATSLRQLLGRHVEVEVVAAAILRQSRHWYRRATAGQVADVLEVWRKGSVDWWGRAVVARAGEQEIRGVAKDIDPDGALLLQMEGGQLRRVLSGEVTRVRPAEGGA